MRLAVEVVAWCDRLIDEGVIRWVKLKILKDYVLIGYVWQGICLIG